MKKNKPTLSIIGISDRNDNNTNDNNTTNTNTNNKIKNFKEVISEYKIFKAKCPINNKSFKINSDYLKASIHKNVESKYYIININYVIK